MRAVRSNGRRAGDGSRVVIGRRLGGSAGSVCLDSNPTETSTQGGRYGRKRGRLRHYKKTRAGRDWPARGETIRWHEVFSSRTRFRLLHFILPRLVGGVEGVLQRH